MIPPPPPQAIPPPLVATTSLPSHHNQLPDLPTALFGLSSLIDISASALRSFPITSAETTSLLPCPFNATHQVPPPSLFSHYLRCPSVLSLSHTLHYPHTLEAPPSSAISFSSSSSDLCFSLENYLDHNTSVNNFFFQNCPGPVLLVNDDRSVSAPPSLTLPEVLYIECANFKKDEGSLEQAVISVNQIKLLPSEIWAIQNEIEGWRVMGTPTSYSFSVLRAILKLQDCLLLRLREWVVVNSPKYGIIIDCSMRDHMLSLIKLFLKAIIKEAFGLAGFLFSDEESNLDLSIQRFECPVLLNVFMWLASQFGILYGEVNGRLFTLDVLKECVVESSVNASCFPLEENAPKMSGEDELEGELEETVVSRGAIDNTSGNQMCKVEGQTVGRSAILVSQVAAAVAALHERSMLEGNIRATRDSWKLSGYQRYVQHASISKIADEERKKRSDYRPVIEHDGVLWQSSRNQDSNKVKTKEELLAEERDYRRRRMSYRGKKSKRNAVAVVRDIIEEYMEEIRQAGEADSSAKITKETETSGSEKRESATVVTGSRINYRESKVNEGQSYGNINELYSSYDPEDDLYKGQTQRQDSSWYNGSQDFGRNSKRLGHNRDDHSKNVDGRSNSSHSQEPLDSKRKASEGSSTRSYKSRTSREHSSYNRGVDYVERDSYKRERDTENWDHKDRGRNKTFEDRRDREEKMDGHRDGKKTRTIRDYRDREEKMDRHRDGKKSKTIRDYRGREEDIDMNYDKRRSILGRDSKNSNDNDGERRKIWRSKTYKNNSSRSSTYDEFEDRYDPLKSHVFDDV